MFFLIFPWISSSGMRFFVRSKISMASSTWFACAIASAFKRGRLWKEYLEFLDIMSSAEKVRSGLFPPGREPWFPKSPKGRSARSGDFAFGLREGLELSLPNPSMSPSGESGFSFRADRLRFGSGVGGTSDSALDLSARLRLWRGLKSRLFESRATSSISSPSWESPSNIMSVLSMGLLYSVEQSLPYYLDLRKKS